MALHKHIVAMQKQVGIQTSPDETKAKFFQDSSPGSRAHEYTHLI